jgi:hypothetical protein
MQYTTRINLSEFAISSASSVPSWWFQVLAQNTTSATIQVVISSNFTYKRFIQFDAYLFSADGLRDVTPMTRPALPEDREGFRELLTEMSVTMSLMELVKISQLGNYLLFAAEYRRPNESVETEIQSTQSFRFQFEEGFKGMSQSGESISLF